MALKQHDFTTLHSAVDWMPRAETLAADYAVCHQIMVAASKNYSFAARFLPADRLYHVEALYALMRVGDDLVDVYHTGAAAEAAIHDFEAQYWRTFEIGDSPHPVLRAYLHTAHKFNIAPELLRPYFRAMIDDLTINRFPTFGDLVYYMEGSALPVGRVMAHILGTITRRVSDVYPQADALSIAMQLSNFLRDVGQDWRLGRVYIPQEDLERFGCTENDIASQRITRHFIDLIEFQIERSDQYYAEARKGIPLLATGQTGVMSGLNIYRAILFAIRRNNYNVFTRRAGAGKLRKVMLVANSWWQMQFIDQL